MMYRKSLVSDARHYLKELFANEGIEIEIFNIYGISREKQKPGI